MLHLVAEGVVDVTEQGTDPLFHLSLENPANNTGRSETRKAEKNRVKDRGEVNFKEEIMEVY